ncbi:wall-associated receptor kinase 2-like [Cucumis melo var. makuwa]|uniref:Wall-associated receptor kinase 2-like n=1 Tax=Cucumis melo var. makuwa TaxID=1194695 RepID=A0A5D3E4P7_CUCMM|nr:wall-associated receptor kinase 2-like [Cucumis melo var. makuwa]TYK30902.1 wall-associated receptor kinase 2-like [Cucumis melo var. makuwa]
MRSSVVKNQRIRRRGSSAKPFFNVLRRRGRESTAFFKFFSRGVVVLRVLQHSSTEESWVDNVLRRRGPSSEGFFDERNSLAIQHRRWVVGLYQGDESVEVCERDPRKEEDENHGFGKEEEPDENYGSDEEEQSNEKEESGL